MIAAAVTLLWNDGDRDYDELMAVLSAGPAHGTLVDWDGIGGFVYQADPGFVGVDHFIYRVSDGHSLSGPVLVWLHVEDVPPEAFPDGYIIWMGESLTDANVLDNDWDADGDELSAELVSGPSHAATFEFNVDGSFTYIPESGFAGWDSFQYVVQDSAGGTATALVAVHVLGDEPELPDPGEAQPGQAGVIGKLPQLTYNWQVRQIGDRQFRRVAELGVKNAIRIQRNDPNQNQNIENASAGAFVWTNPNALLAGLGLDLNAIQTVENAITAQLTNPALGYANVEVKREVLIRWGARNAAMTPRPGVVEVTISVVLNVTGTKGGKSFGRIETLAHSGFSYVDENLKEAELGGPINHTTYWDIPRYGYGSNP